MFSNWIKYSNHLLKQSNNATLQNTPFTLLTESLQRFKIKINQKCLVGKTTKQEVGLFQGVGQ